ncbi:MAG: HD domain-containing protein, partial [Chloroflexi bacterium]|nr:HD domain-containing protein [Chloroflexota bacterium]
MSDDIALRVLILEDLPADAEIVLQEMKRSGYQCVSRRVDTQQVFLEALEMVPDIILAENSLPKFKALQALQLLQERGLDIPLIVVTESSDAEAAVEAMRHGAADYLLNTRLSRLGAAVQRALHQKMLRAEKRKAENDLQRAYSELSAAYEATIEGWSRVLDLRDKELDGHTRRVTELTVRMAQALKISEDQIIHIRRGALLHDIGKMAISDGILQKPGPLSEDEWHEMRRHPEYAHQMLFPIAHLRPALEIPYCHHERWDGTGYPRGIKGAEIPLSARIFSIIDVWDTLLASRPYRPGGTEESVA